MNRHHEQARAHYFEGDLVSAEKQLRLAARDEHMPAMFILGLEIHRQKFGAKYEGEGIDLLKAASDMGHVPAGKWFHHLTARNSKSIHKSVRSLFHRLPLLIKGLWLRRFQPASDRIQIW